MNLTTQQVKEKLHVGDRRLANLVEEGKIKPVNERKPGAKKFFARYNSVDVNKLFQEMKHNGTVPAPRAQKAVAELPVADGIRTTLARIEAKLDALTAMWK
jgi:hypothetical protein